jgi:excisionase family DNA binding protein
MSATSVPPAAAGEPPLLLDAAGVARLLNVSTRTLWRLTDVGEFPPPVAVGRLRRWPRSAVMGWIAHQTPPTRR